MMYSPENRKCQVSAYAQAKLILCLSRQSNGSTSQGSDSQREAVDRGLGPLACLTLMLGH